MQRNLSLDILRILACLGVITIHTSGSPIVHQMVEKGSVWYTECMVLNALVRWSVPVFAMLTGFFLLDPKKEVSFKSLFSRYLVRIFVALVFWSFFYAVSLHKPFYPLGSQEGHFWYLEMLIGLYLSIPILRLIASNEATLKYCCLVWIVFMCYAFMANFFALPIKLGDILFPRFAGYCLAAYWIKTSLSERTSNNNLSVALYFLGAVGLLFTVFVGYRSQNPETVFYSYDAPNVMVTAFAVFLFFVRHPLSHDCTGHGLIEECSRCTFGIYLIHLWLLIQIFFRMHRFIPGPIPLTILCVSVTFFIAFGITWLIRRIPYLNRLIV